MRARAKNAAFVSRDRDYAGADELLEEGIELPRATVGEIIQALKGHQQSRSLDEATQRLSLINASLQNSSGDLRALEDFVCANFRLPDNLDYIAVSVRNILQIRGLRMVAAEVRNLVPHIEDVRPGASVRLTVFVLTRLDVLARVEPLPEAPTGPYGLGVGEERSTAQVQWRPPQDNSTVEPRFVDVVGLVEVTAIRTPDGYDNFRPMALSVPTSRAFSGSRRRDADEWVAEMKKQGRLDPFVP